MLFSFLRHYLNILRAVTVIDLELSLSLSHIYLCCVVEFVGACAWAGTEANARGGQPISYPIIFYL